MLLPFGRSRRQSAPPPRSARLRVEHLEDRTVPSRPLPYPVIFTGTGAGAPAAVRAFAAETGETLFERTAFEQFRGGVHVAAADFTKDGFPDAVVAAGAGGGPHVRVLDGKTGEQVPGAIGSFFAYDGRFRGGVSVAAADVDGDTIPDVITAAGAGGGPHVKVFSGATGTELHSFFAREPGFRGGASLAAADFTGDGKAEVVVGAGVGGGPRVRILDLTTGRPVAGAQGDFFALDSVGRAGVAVGTDALAGDVNGDRVPDLVVGSGPDGPARAVVYSGKDGSTLADFRPFGDDLVSGVRVATAFVDDDAFADVVVGTGPGVAATVRVFSGTTFEQLPGRVGEFRPFGDGELGGVFVGASNDPPSYAIPESAADAYAIAHDRKLEAGGQTVLPGLLGNDRDRDNDALTARLVGPAEGKPAPLGQVTIELDGSFTYTPPAKFVGKDTFWYVAKDAVAEGTPVPVSISVVNHNATAAAGEVLFFAGQAKAGTVGMQELDGDTITATLLEPPAGGLVWPGNGTYTYTPPNPAPIVDRFRYTVSDGLTTSVVGTVHLETPYQVTIALVATGGAYHTIHDRYRDGMADVTGLAYAPDPELPPPPVVVVVTAGPFHGALALKADREFRYTPAKGYVGDDYFEYYGTDGLRKSNLARVYFTVGNTQPVARADAFVTGQTTPITKSVATNDDDGDSDALTFEVVSGVSEGKLEFQANGTFTYTPDADFVGVDKFTYKVGDGRDWTQATTAYVTVFEAPGSSIGDYVWVDENRDGLQDPTEKGIENAKVELLRFDYATSTYDEKAAVETYTLSGGWYSFNDLYSGKYKLRYTNPVTSQYLFTFPDEGSDGIDSDGYANLYDELAATTKEIVLPVNTYLSTQDGGVLKPVLDLDVNADGDFDDPEDKAENYLPGYEGLTQKVSTGTKFSQTTYTGQAMKLILEGVGKKSGGQFHVEFVITSSTNHPGYASNGKAAEVIGQGKEMDYSFLGTADNTNKVVDANTTPNEQTKEGGKMEDKKTWVYFWAKDYGGSCKVEARIYKKDANGNIGPLLQTVKLVVPKDVDDDGLADKWERAMLARWKTQYFELVMDPNDISLMAPTQDKELPDPDGWLSNPRQVEQAEFGDAHVVLEEYRGYILDGGGLDGTGSNGHSGGHLRLDPARKEYLVEIDSGVTITNPAIPAGGLNAAVDKATGVFSNTAQDANGREKGAGIYVYYVFDEVDLDLSKFKFVALGDHEVELKNSRDTAVSRASGAKNLKTDFVHMLLVDDYLAGVPAPAITEDDHPDLDRRGVFIAVTKLKELYTQGVTLGRLNANMWGDFFSTTVAHELTHLIGAKPGAPGFDAFGHVTNPDEDAVVNPSGLQQQRPVPDPDDLLSLMYFDSWAENKELGTVKFFNLEKRVLIVKTSDGLNP